MDTQLEELIKILQREEKIFREYLELLTEQQGNLMKNDLEAIRQGIQKISQLAGIATELENARRIIVAKLSEKLRVKPNDINLSEMLDKVNGAPFDELESLKNKVLEFHEKIMSQSRRNELLINQSMNILSQSIQLMNQSDDPLQNDIKQGVFCVNTDS